MVLLSSVIMRGLAADRPATAAPGALYFSSDTGVLERYSGSAWQSYSAAGAFSAVGHTHSAADVTAGTFATARLGSGAASASTYLRGDSAWAAIPPASRLLYAQPSIQAGDTVTNTTTPTAFASKYTIPTASFVVGRVFRVTAGGSGAITTAARR
jgi:hypothetical protein